MRLTPGSRFGRYEVLAHIGTGGMGEVYRARDTHLDRPVALKTIAAVYARDPAAQPRFAREARLTASLQHPHICALLDAGREGDVEYLAMEYLDGESLATRLRRGRVPPAEAIEYAIEVADALSFAHRQGIVHRDLKPGNVFLTTSGAKLLDFGLAKLRTVQDPSHPMLTNDTAPLEPTQTGMVFGSVAYLAPERLEGREGDVRSDVFAFGAVLYEMLTARPAFQGGSPAALIAAILSAEPAPLDVDHPQADDVEWLIRKCLAKKPDERWQSMADVHAVLRRLAGTRAPRAAASGRRWSSRAALVLLPLCALALGWMLARVLVREPGPPDPVAMTIGPPRGGRFTPTEGSVETAQLALSADGRTLAFVAADANGTSQLWIRRRAVADPIPLAGTEGATYPFWSPDGRSLGFFSRGALRRVDISGGPPQRLASAPNGRGGAWNEAGDILFAPDITGPIHRVSDDGSSGTPVTQLEAARNEQSHRWPVFLPGGRRFLFFARTSSQPDPRDGLHIGSLDGGGAKPVVATVAGGAFLPPAHLLFLRDDTLLGVRLDPASGSLTGEPEVVAQQVGSNSNNYGAFAAAADGTIAYARTAPASELRWFDRAGRPAEDPVSAGRHVDFRLSPNGLALALAEVDPDSGRPDIFVLDLARPPTRYRVTDSRATDASPVWAPDGRQLAFRSNRGKVHDLFLSNLGGVDQDRRFHTSDTGKYPTSWSPDGRLVAFHTRRDETHYDILVAGVPDGGEQPLRESKFEEAQAQFSPDGRWIAYTSNESGTYEVWIVSADLRTAPQPISVKGGSDPRWRKDGSELFYISAAGQLTAVPLKYRNGAIQPGAPHDILRVVDPIIRPPYLSMYDVTGDGQRFLVRVPLEDAATMPLTLLLHARLPGGP